MTAAEGSITERDVMLSTNDHICCSSDLSMMRSHYPGWERTKSLRLIVEEIVLYWRRRISH